MKEPVTFKVFDYIPELDAFVVNQEFEDVSKLLGLIEWNPVVWIGRLFSMDNDYGEHWMDNWKERDGLEEAAAKLGIAYERLMIVNPDNFANYDDGPCHEPELRKLFWVNVLKSLRLEIGLLFQEARRENQRTISIDPEMGIPNLEEVIQGIHLKYDLDSDHTYGVLIKLDSHARKSPPGETYAPTTVIDGKTWSVVLEFKTNPVFDVWIPAQLRFMAEKNLVQLTRGSHELLEGSKVVGKIQRF